MKGKRPPLRYESTPYVKAKHGGFVCTSWCTGSGERAVVLERKLASPDVRCLLAHKPGNPDVLYGWVAVELVTGRWSVVWCYTRELFDRIRERGIMTGLLLELGVDVSQPTPCLFWSPDAAEITARGYRFIYAPKGLKQREPDGLKEAA